MAPSGRWDPLIQGAHFTLKTSLLKINPAGSEITLTRPQSASAKEVMALIGFTRLEPIVRGVDGDPIDQLDIGAKRADINNKELDWVPAIENFGEGLFLGVSESVLQAWIEKDGVKPQLQHREACKLWNRDHGLKLTNSLGQVRPT